MNCLLASGLESIPGDHVKWTVGLLIILAGFGIQIFMAVRSGSTRVTPDPLRVEKLDKFATRDFCQLQHEEVSRRLAAHDEAIRGIHEELKRDRLQNQQHASERSKTLFNAIEGVRDELTEKIDAMPDRIIRLMSDLNLLNKPK